jgi:hypothetical protein
MKHLLTGVAVIAALAFATPVWAQYDNPSGGNSVGLPGPNPGGPGLTPYSGGDYGSTTGTPPQYYAPPPAAGTSSTEAATNEPLAYPPQPPGWSPARNVAESEHYTSLLEHNRGFREARMRIECRPVTDPQLYQRCIDSFAAYSPWAGAGPIPAAPAYGSSTPQRQYSSGAGR